MAGTGEYKASAATILWACLLDRLQAKGVLDEADRKAIIDDAIARFLAVDPDAPEADFIRATFNLPRPEQSSSQPVHTSRARR